MALAAVHVHVIQATVVVHHNTKERPYPPTSYFTGLVFTATRMVRSAEVVPIEPSASRQVSCPPPTQWQALSSSSEHHDNRAVLFQDEEEPEASFFVRERHLTLRQLRKAFPFHGRFHFRARRRVPAPTSAPAYVWLDLIAEDDVVPHGRRCHHAQGACSLSATSQTMN